MSLGVDIVTDIIFHPELEALDALAVTVADRDSLTDQLDDIVNCQYKKAVAGLNAYAPLLTRPLGDEIYPLFCYILECNAH